MRIAKQDIPTKLAVPGATARQSDDFGDASKHGPLAAEYFSRGAGTVIVVSMVLPVLLRRRRVRGFPGCSSSRHCNVLIAQ